MPSSVDPSKCRVASKEERNEGWRKEAESTPFARAHDAREGGAGPSKLINEINLSAIFGGKVGKGKRGRRAEGTWNMMEQIRGALETM